MHGLLDLDRYPLDQLDSPDGEQLVARCRADLAAEGMFSLDALVRPEAVERVVAEVQPRLDADAFTHQREHNIYFETEVAGLAADHPALKQFETVNHTVCADQIPKTLVMKIYEWPAIAAFLAKVMDLNELHMMDDPLGCLNVMAYHDGEALNWHFDRSEFTTTLLLQAPTAGGEFQYRTDLRSDDNPNYEGVAAMVDGRDAKVNTIELSTGTLNVFRGKNTAHRVTPVEGDRDRIIAVFCYYEQPGMTFSDEERLGFYGRTS